MVVARMLEKHGYRPVVVPDGRQALEALARDRNAAVLMDCHMPDVDGYEATRRLRELEGERRHTPVIAMTASVMEGDRERCLVAGMDDFIGKPLEPDAVKAVLERWVASQGGDQDAAVDPALLDDLGRRMGDDAGARMIADLINLFLRDTPERIVAIRIAAEAGDAAALREAAHALRGSTAAVGAPRMADLCASLEEMGATGSVGDAPPMAAELEEAFTETKQALEDRLHSKEVVRWTRSG